jgi:hypothetical protein
MRTNAAQGLVEKPTMNLIVTPSGPADPDNNQDTTGELFREFRDDQV